MVGFSFLLTEIETGRVVAHTVLCAEARYASVLHRGSGTIYRHLGTAFQWLNIEEQLTRRINGGPVHRGSSIVSLLLEPDRRSSVFVQHLVSTPFTFLPDDAAATLDAHLRDFAGHSVTV